MKKLNLNENEQKIIDTLCNNSSSGASSKDELKADNMTWFNESDIKSMGFTKHQASGYMSDLEKKGLISNDDPNDKYGWVVTDKGIDHWNNLA